MKMLSAILFSALISSSAMASFADVDEKLHSYCFGNSMVGYDNVINASKGLDINTMLVLLDPVKDAMTVEIVKSAYEWAKKPHPYSEIHYHAHDYGTRAFHKCLLLNSNK